ncbi:hypothetical protein EYR40_004272 [Pleurotus pulmonarius]|nr:hypothetical protein EYR36_007156 [Pleurotus pulmonarius]KAF4605488.1 hypothetical protein EYR40_004272 [Pleurotus pulmonarius]KAF4606977.1 hypothetical protein EYR38_001032 [Pleurotus pulmonarius]
MAFAPRPGCPMCGIVTTALHAPSNSPRSPSFPVGSTQPEVLWRDDNFTAYREKANPVSSKGHIIIAFNLHVPSIYTLSSTDLPLLVNVRNLATRLLTSFLPPSSPTTNPRSSEQYPEASPPNASMPSPSAAAFLTPTSSYARRSNETLNSPAVPPQTPLHAHPDFHIGFITPPFKDTKIPVTDHLHAHAYIGPGDLMGWWRGVAYSSIAWYDIDDLIAEIRESVSNNRIKSGYENRGMAPIDMVPGAGARCGTADGTETSEPGLALPDAYLEDGERTPAPAIMRRPITPNTLEPQNRIPSLTV